MSFAADFYEILSCLEINRYLKSRIKNLIKEKSIHGKALEGDNRLNDFKSIILTLVDQKLSLNEAYILTEQLLSEHNSPYAGNKRVFCQHWGERLIRIQLSKFYNEAVLLTILEDGGTTCFISHSTTENNSSPCSIHLAGSVQNAEEMLARIINCYEYGVYDKELKIPNHPHCTHVVSPDNVSLS
jgi:hypothetical protein